VASFGVDKALLRALIAFAMQVGERLPEQK
jgi:hypothetical protein